MQFSDHTTLYQKHELRACLNDLGLVRVRVYDPAIARVVLREERLALAYSPHTTIGKRINDSVDLECLNGQVLIVYPSEPRPSFADQRSEERRVGKERRPQWWTQHSHSQEN